MKITESAGSVFVFSSQIFGEPILIETLFFFHFFAEALPAILYERKPDRAKERIPLTSCVLVVTTLAKVGVYQMSCGQTKLTKELK